MTSKGRMKLLVSLLFVAVLMTLDGGGGRFFCCAVALGNDQDLLIMETGALQLAGKKSKNNGGSSSSSSKRGKKDSSSKRGKKSKERGSRRPKGKKDEHRRSKEGGRRSNSRDGGAPKPTGKPRTQPTAKPWTLTKPAPPSTTTKPVAPDPTPTTTTAPQTPTPEPTTIAPVTTPAPTTLEGDEVTLLPTTTAPVVSPTDSPVTDSPTTGTVAPRPAGVDLEWFGQNSYLKASNVLASILDENNNPTYITFQDDLNRPININSGGAGEEISRERAWTEDGVERRLKFYFWPQDVNNTNVDTLQQRALLHGWHLYDARMFNTQGTDWVYWGDGDVRTIHTVQTPPGVLLFHCDYVEYNYRRGGSQNDEEPGGKFVATNVTIGGYLGNGYNVESLQVFDPCAEMGEPCRAIDGAVQCGDTPLTLEDFV